MIGLGYHSVTEKLTKFKTKNNTIISVSESCEWDIGIELFTPRDNYAIRLFSS